MRFTYEDFLYNFFGNILIPVIERICLYEIYGRSWRNGREKVPKNDHATIPVFQDVDFTPLSGGYRHWVYGKRLSDVFFLHLGSIYTCQSATMFFCLQRQFSMIVIFQTFESWHGWSYLLQSVRPHCYVLWGQESILISLGSVRVYTTRIKCFGRAIATMQFAIMRIGKTDNNDPIDWNK